MMDLLDRLLGHDRWTTTQYLEASKNLSDEQLDQEFDIGLRSLRATFDHMIFNVEAWTAVMIGESADDVSRDGRSIDEMLKRHERSYDAFASVARQMNDSQRLDETYGDFYNVLQSMGGTIIHVILHNSQHRAEVLHMLRRLGVEDTIEGDPQEWEHLTGLIARFKG
jgi:uncharacterized damage-inducible protein DinB